MHTLTLWLHRASVVLLFLFLIAAQYLQIDAWWKIKRAVPTASVAATYRRLWMLTEIVPPAVAASILLTGLRLIWDSPATNAPSNLWMFVLICGFSVFFWDGIFGFTKIVGARRRRWERAARNDVPVVNGRASQHGEAVQLFAHFISWPLLVPFGVFRWGARTLVTDAVSNLEKAMRILPTGWPEVFTAVIIWATIGFAVALTRGAARRAGSSCPPQ
jgi:hypothetical protein